VLDFQANTIEARRWMRGILEQTKAARDEGFDVILHKIDDAGLPQKTPDN